MKRFLFYILLILLVSSCKRTEVDVVVTADFTYEVQDSNYTIPVRIVFVNKSIGAQFYKWTFEGSTPGTYDKRDPGVVSFTKAGSVKVILEAWSDLGRQIKEIIIQLDSVPKADFATAALINNLGVTDFAITNKSYGGVTKYAWSFPGGIPASSIEKNPPAVKYTNPGEYRIFLEAKNDRGRKDTISKLIKVLPGLSANFDIVPSFDDEDYQAPLVAVLQNNTISATQHKWQAPGGTLSNSTDSVPTVTYSLPGTYTVTYKAGNGKDSATVTKNITVLPNTGLRTFANVKLGINTAQSTLGVYFSTILRKVLLKGDVNASNGNKIDIAFYGLSESFNYNLFISPDSAQVWAFDAIPGGTATKLINSQELCGCGVNFTVANFDNVTTGTAFSSVPINVTTAGNTFFSNALVPRVVLFQNAIGKKGAVKIKQYVSAGQQSYIICDIKVQKD